MESPHPFAFIVYATFLPYFPRDLNVLVALLSMPKEVIENVRTHVNTYEDSIRYHNEMIQMAAIKDSIANSLFKEVNEIKKKINQK